MAAVNDLPAGGAEILARYRRQQWRRAAVLAVLLAVVGWCLDAAGLLDVPRLTKGLPAIRQLVAEMLPPDFRRAEDWRKPLLDTFIMSVAGTVLTVLLAMPLAFLVARNTSPHPVVSALARGLLSLLRAVPELILGIVFVAAVGFGVLPGVLASGLHSAGMVGKFYAEAIEHADPGPVEAVRSVGARPFQVFWHGVLPQVLPQMADVTIYRWEYHFRASTVLGMVGAGGIGLELMGALRLMQYREVAAILLLVLVLVVLVDGFSGYLRKRLK